MKLAAALLVSLLCGCGALSRLSEIGRPPGMTRSSDPTKEDGWRPITMPMPKRENTPNEANALWRPGSRAFFKDQRAAQVGDIVTVLVTMNDSANLNNASSANRTGTETAGLPHFFGMEALLPKTIVDPTKLLSSSSSNAATGTGQIKRSEAVTLRLARSAVDPTDPPAT